MHWKLPLKWVEEKKTPITRGVSKIFLNMWNIYKLYFEMHWHYIEEEEEEERALSACKCFIDF